MNSNLHVSPSYLSSAAISPKLFAEVAGQKNDVRKAVTGEFEQKMVEERRPIHRQQWLGGFPRMLAETGAKAADQHSARPSNEEVWGCITGLGESSGPNLGLRMDRYFDHGAKNVTNDEMPLLDKGSRIRWNSDHNIAQIYHATSKLAGEADSLQTRGAAPP